MQTMLDISEEFIASVWAHYHKHKKHMPWREKCHPYRVLLSEFMLQQTQISRCIRYFNAFIRRWPDIFSLNTASLSELLSEWQGLGYNRRAKYLKQSVHIIVSEHKGIVPRSKEVLIKCPGIGEYTAAAISVFAYNNVEIVLETNIRRAVLHFFFPNKDIVSDAEVKEVLQQVVDRNNPREWYWALMDYGSYLSTIVENPNRKSARYRRQSKFEGSTRQIRGEIVRALSRQSAMAKEKMIAHVQRTLKLDFVQTGKILLTEELVEQLIQQLVDEEMIVTEGQTLYLP